MATALVSLAKGKKINRSLAMTGELTLSGRILPVGGVKEKVLAAHRAGVKAVVFPARNDSDIKDIPEDIKKDIQIVEIDELEEVIDVVLN